MLDLVLAISTMFSTGPAPVAVSDVCRPVALQSESYISPNGNVITGTGDAGSSDCCDETSFGITLFGLPENLSSGFSSLSNLTNVTVRVNLSTVCNGNTSSITQNYSFTSSPSVRYTASSVYDMQIWSDETIGCGCAVTVTLLSVSVSQVQSFNPPVTQNMPASGIYTAYSWKHSCGEEQCP